MKTFDQVVEMVRKERVNQISQWGGRVHDEKHSVHEWLTYIEHQVLRCAAENGNEKYSPSEVEKRFVKIAALAVAAIESGCP